MTGHLPHATGEDQAAWQRLSPRMLLVHPLHEALRELPLLLAVVIFGSTTDNQLSVLILLWVIAVIGVARWFTTTYRIEPGASGRLELKTGLLRRKRLSVPRNRIRSVHTEARLLHRLLGLTVLRVSTGQEAATDQVFELDAVDSAEVPQWRAVLLAHSTAGPAGEAGEVGEAGELAGDRWGAPVALARWQPSWLRYSALSLSGLVTIFAGVGVVLQSGVWDAFEQSPLGRATLETAEGLNAATAIPVAVVALLVLSVLLAVLRSWVAYGNLTLSRAPSPGGDVLELRYGLLRVRQRSYDMRRLRGGTLRRPLLVRLFGGARLDAAMTGVTGVGESALLLPPCPAPTAEAVLAGLVGDDDVVHGALRRHGPVATRRRWTRAMILPGLLAVALGSQYVPEFAVVDLPEWSWAVCAVLTGCCGLLAADRSVALGHRVDRRWLVARDGSLERRRDCIETDGIIAWTVHQSWFQRRAGVATLIAATAAGMKGYRVIDVPVEWAWQVAATASPWVADSTWMCAPGER